MKCWSCEREVGAKVPRCPHCGRWGTVGRWRPMIEVERKSVERVTTGSGELDALLGGGWVPGCAYLLSGPPGCGKSTLALQVAAKMPSLYAVAEESAGAVRLRFDRLACESPDLMVGEIEAVEDLADVPAGVGRLVVDSIHGLRSPAVSGAAGSNAQLLHAVELLIRQVRISSLVVLIIAHVNKDGDASGTMGLEHDVDALLEMRRGDSEPGSIYVRKNRHGPAPAHVAVQVGESGIRFIEEAEG